MNHIGADQTAWMYKLVCASVVRIQSKEEGKDQETIKSSSTPDSGHHIVSDKT